MSRPPRITSGRPGNGQQGDPPTASRPDDVRASGFLNSDLLKRLLDEKPEGIRITRSASTAVAANAAGPIITHARPETAPARDELRHLPDSVTDKLDQFVAEQKAVEPRKPSARQSNPAGGKSPKADKPGKGKVDAPAAASAVPKVIAEPTQRNITGKQGPRPGDDEIRHAIIQSRSAFVGIGILSFLINILMLTGPLFMLQVYDRVMTSGSMSTLLALSLITAVLYGMTGFFELLRTRIVSRVSVEIDQRLSDRIFKASLRRSLFKQGASTTALRDLDTVRQFASGPAPMTFFDAPWAPIYLLVIFLVHWMLGLAALIGMGLILAMTLLSERTARQPLAEANKSAVRSLEMADSAQRNVEALAAMGMIEAYRKRWQKVSSESLSWQVSAADRLGSAASIGKAVRLLLQSMMLAVGAGLAISGDISAGSIIAGTIIFGRALAPIEQGVAQWKSFVKARESFDKLKALLREEPEPPVRTALPAPKGRIEISQLRVAAPDTRKLILANLNFVVKPGELCAVIGPSASGKSTLARTLVGLWPPFSGTISIDGADLQQWNPEALGRYIGYLPQDVELFSGTVRENISRFRDDAQDEAVIEAAQMAHAHEMILALPQGYDTQLGSFGTYLSAGQRQRIGLARALFGDPVFVVLDEPNANLDRLGDEALTSALAGMKKRGQAVILISHRVQAMSLANTLLYVDRGVQRAFGPQAEVMKLFKQNAPGLAPNASQVQSGQQQSEQRKQGQPQPAPAQSGQSRAASQPAPQPAPQPTLQTAASTSAAAVAASEKPSHSLARPITQPPPAQTKPRPEQRSSTVVVLEDDGVEAPAMAAPAEIKITASVSPRATPPAAPPARPADAPTSATDPAAAESKPAPKPVSAAPSNVSHESVIATPALAKPPVTTPALSALQKRVTLPSILSIGHTASREPSPDPSVSAGLTRGVEHSKSEA